MNADSPMRKWLVLAGLVPGLFLAMADALIMSIAVAELIQRFGTNGAHRLRGSSTATTWC